MQSLRRCIVGLASVCTSTIGCRSLNIIPKNVLSAASIHTSSIWDKQKTRGQPTKFINYNKVIYPPQGPDEERRPAFICHQAKNVKYSRKKMWYIASFVRGMSVDEAIKQLSFSLKKGSAIVKNTIIEAQNLAVEKHNVEFKSNLWVAESFCSKGLVIKGIRRHARRRVGEIRYGYVHYFVRLEEGKPPLDYYGVGPRDKDTLLAKWKEGMRSRKITNSL